MKLLLLLGAATKRHHDHLLPGSTVLTFDHTLPRLEALTISNIDTSLTQQYRNVSIQYFRRIPVKIDIESVPDTASSLEVKTKLSFLDDTDTVPTLLLHKKVFGGNQAIWYDTSNFCDWLTKHGAQSLATPVSTSLRLDIQPRKGLFSKGVHEVL
eukprot:Protomagalhaensia_wolfi_Nauph_80__355@NODE_1199_length_1664_cov_18_417846_g920_i0_p2_GENE_NODE_1199_length_1664_cov_18_417846_g920_i0NODE_1199_length_1664_cov_18_417846_g920_i0_p2_ORF_typecomplete_len155_score19_88_NODE_1199_length_1664_cov_18_417846_g920_i059523